MLHTFAGIYQVGNDVKNKAFDYCKTVKVVIEKKIENRHSHCLRNIISVSRLLNLMSTAKD